MKAEIFNAALAGLLHDIGKVAQRARIDPWKAAEGTEECKQPVHATYSLQMIQNYVPKPYCAAALAGAYHHRPQFSEAQDKSLSFLIDLADKLSAGERDEYEENDSSSGDGKHSLPKQMFSLLRRIGSVNDGVGINSNQVYLPLKPLKLKEENIFPCEPLTEQEQRTAYEEITQALVKVLQQSSDDQETYLENILSGLQQLTWCIPSSYYYNYPDISLYDHARSTAALAVCLTDFNNQEIRSFLDVVERCFHKNIKPEDEPLLETPVALLIGGDISGIQDFIYTITSKKAAQMLRGRSFYLQLLTEAVLRFTLRELGLPYTNVIYTGGGHFFLLAPLSCNEHIPKLQHDITNKLLKAHDIHLYLAIGYTKVPLSGFRIGSFPIYWNEMHQRINLAKLQRYIELGEKGIHEALFQAQIYGGDQEKVCSVCGEEKAEVGPFEDEEGRICSMCSSFYEQIGKMLPKSKGVLLGLGETQETSLKCAFDVLKSFGMTVKFIKDFKEDKTELKKGLGDVSRAILWILDDVENDLIKEFSIPTAILSRYVVNQVPPLDFDELEKKAVGIKRLGVLRMDVDDLGHLFNEGFIIKDNNTEKSIATIARLSNLSFLISLFFEGWVKHICKEFSNHIYAVYAGGDDLFLILPWDITPKLALKIRNDFKRYVAYNENIHLSSGVAFIGGKEAVYQAAEEAYEALSKAKNVEPNSDTFKGKNSITFLDQVWKWDEFESVHQKFELLRNLVQERKEDGLGGPKSILQLLIKLAEMETERQKSDRGLLSLKNRVWGRWMWLGDYYLTRLAEISKNEIKDTIMKIYSALRETMYSDIGAWGCAARWTQLFIRDRLD